jgi:hypothetical protein
MEKEVMNPKCLLLVIFNGASARDEAVRYCDSLAGRFWPDFSFEVSWCDWADLSDPVRAKEADQKAEQAEFIVIASASSKDLPNEVKSWLELALHGRGDREGVLVGLPVAGNVPRAKDPLTELYLRKLAHMSGMDYLNALPQSLTHLFPESFEPYNTRATQVTSVLDRILHQPTQPTRMLE